MYMYCVLQTIDCTFVSYWSNTSVYTGLQIDSVYPSILGVSFQAIKQKIFIIISGINCGISWFRSNKRNQLFTRFWYIWWFLMWLVIWWLIRGCSVNGWSGDGLVTGSCNRGISSIVSIISLIVPRMSSRSHTGPLSDETTIISVVTTILILKLQY